MNTSLTIKGVSLEKPLSKYIDHTLLKPDASAEQIEKICQEALQYDFASVCVNSCYAGLVSRLLKGSEVKTCCVVGFPLGAMLSEAKAFETKAAIDQGAQEIDMVINIGAVKSGDLALVKSDIVAVVSAAEHKALVKVIIETCLLTKDEIVKVCTIAKDAGADFVKTSTGFSTGGALAADVALMRKTVGGELGVKASGGIRDLDSTLEMINAGASRIGASAGIKIIEQVPAE
ncbi:MAG: deoxyribose-phosphate aldolase [Oscillospiraceae bacterium]